MIPSEGLSRKPRQGWVGSGVIEHPSHTSFSRFPDDVLGGALSAPARSCHQVAVVSKLRLGAWPAWAARLRALRPSASRSETKAWRSS